MILNAYTVIFVVSLDNGKIVRYILYDCRIFIVLCKSLLLDK
jgi:hypothetical protein